MNGTEEIHASTVLSDILVQDIGGFSDFVLTVALDVVPDDFAAKLAVFEIWEEQEVNWFADF